MPTDPAVPSFLPWARLSERERLVWAVAFGQGAEDPADAAHSADAAVRRLRALVLDPDTALDPEYEAARAGFHFEFEEFEPWYRVAWRLRHGHATSFHAPTREEIREAYDRFQQGRGDFY
jgi:hypothetical protein